jgi:hypothetical protein
MTSAAFTLPFLSEADPEQSGEGSLDPLGLVPVADRLAEEIAPGITARMSRIRFVTAMAVGAVATERLSDVTAADGVSPPYLAFEWHLVEALGRDRYLPTEATFGVPGIAKARSAVARGVHLDAASYLKVPKVFGFTGIYKRLARASEVVDDQLLLAAGGDRLVRVWEEEQGFPGFADRESGTLGGQLASNVERAVSAALSAGKATLPLGSHLWSKLVRTLRPDGAGPRERALIWDLLTDSETPMRREVILGVHRLDLEGTEAETLRALQADASPDLSDRLQAIDAYERVAELLTASFETLRAVSTGRGTTPVGPADLSQNGVLVRAARELSAALDDAYRRLDPLALGTALADATTAYDGVRNPPDLVEALLARHERVQEAKGKRPWFEQTTRGFVVRPLYRTGTSREINGTYVHPYRVNAIRSFLADLR